MRLGLWGRGTVEAESAVLSPNQHSRGHVLRRTLDTTPQYSLYSHPSYSRAAPNPLRKTRLLLCARPALFALRLASSPRRPGTGFASFGAFRSEMTAAGPAAQELLPLHLKVRDTLPRLFRDISGTLPRQPPETTARVSLLPPLLPAASLLPALTAAALTAAALTAAALTAAAACAAGHGAACFTAHLV